MAESKSTPPDREPQTAVAPLDTIAPEDVGQSAAQFDAWLRSISGDYLTLERLTTVAGSLPIVGNLIALVDVIMGVVEMIQKYARKQVIEFMDWLDLGINLIGVIPIPPALAAARMSLRPALNLLKQKIKQSKGDIGEAVITVLALNLSDKFVGELEKFVDEALSMLPAMLNHCVQKIDEIANDLIDVLKRCLGDKPMFDEVSPKAEKALHDPKTVSRWNRMLAAAEQARRAAGNAVASRVAKNLPLAARTVLNGTIGCITSLQGEFRGKLVALADAKVERSIGHLLTTLMTSLKNRKAKGKAQTGHVGDKGGPAVTKDVPGQSLESHKNQADAKNDANQCKLCPAPGGTKKSINFATGAETLTHTDFILAAPLPIEWSRTYRSNLAAFDLGAVGARWLIPYTTRVDTVRQGRKSVWIYRGGDGRSHTYPVLKVGQTHRDAIEEVTLTRVANDLLTLDFGKPLQAGQDSPWRESYELVTTVPSKVKQQGAQHFRLVAVHTLNDAALGLRYDHVVAQGPHAGEQVLSDVLSKQGGQILAHAGTQLDAHSGQIRAVWEIKDGQLVRQLAAYRHDQMGDLVHAQDENAAPWHYEYQHHLLTRYTDRTGRGMNLAYNGTEPDARAVREWADDGSFDTRVEKDKRIRLTYVTDALGQETWVYYDILGYTYRVIHPDQREEWFFRDAAKNVVRHVHTDGSTDAYQYDQAGNLHTHVRADGTRVHFEHDGRNRLTGLLDAEGGEWRREYNAAGQLVQEEDPRGGLTRYTYDSAGRPVTITDAKGGVKKLGYTPSGQLANYTDCSDRTTQWEYDAHGRLVRSLNAAGYAIAYCYTPVSEPALNQAHDPAKPGNHPGQLASVVQADGSEEHFCHDAEGRLLTHTDPLGRTTAYRYTAAGLIEQRTDAMGQQLGYRWDKLGRLVALHNENQRTYAFRYDPVGRLLQERGFDDKLTSYRYEDSTGVLAEVVEVIEATEGPEVVALRTHLEFDPMGRLLERKAQVGDKGLQQSERFGYNGNGQLVQAENSQAKLEWFFDDAGNLVREHQHYLHLAEKQTAVWFHRYDELNQRVGTTRPDGHRLEWLTYGSGHVHGLMLDGKEVVGFERDALHREVGRTQANGLEQTQKYDLVGRLLEQQIGRFQKASVDKAQTTATPAIHRQYGYDRAGHLTRIGDSRRGQIEYRYDPVGRLLQAQTALGQERFAFDPAGNIGEPGNTSWEKANTQMQRPSSGNRVLDNLLKAYAGTNYRYDERGNLTARIHNGEASSFEWDAFNRMTRASTPQGVTTFAYDPLGRRIGKEHESAPRKRLLGTAAVGAVERTLFGWDGDTLAFESAEVLNGKAKNTSASTVHYVHEAGSFVPLMQASVVGPVSLRPVQEIKSQLTDESESGAMLLGGGVDTVEPFGVENLYYYQCDHLGTPQELTDHDGQLAWSAQYKAWGEAKELISDVAKKAGVKNPIRFQGQYFDEETGLHYNRYRYYDPHSGRFASKDPIGLLGGSNNYAYAPNPVGWIDPLGLQSRKSSPARCKTCDPCEGKDPSATARSWQGKKPYDGVDSYKNTVLKKGTVIYTLYPYGPKPGNYYAGSSDVLAGGTGRGYNDAVQVSHSGNTPGARPMRNQVQAFVVKEDICVAKGMSQANPHLGAGGGTQFFVENSDKSKLQAGPIVKYGK